MTYHDLMPEAGTITLEEYLLTGPRHSELVRGRVVGLIPPGGRHGRISNQVAHRITTHVLARNLGTVLAETGFVVERGPDTVRAPDIAFVARGRMKDIDERGFLPLAPDLAVEVVSPTDRFHEVEAKAAMWVERGVRLVWVVEPEVRKVFVYRPGEPREEVGEEGALDGRDVLPGLRLPVADCL